MLKAAPGSPAEFRARLFGPGLDPAGVALGCSLSAFGLQVDGEHSALSVPDWSELRWRIGGMNDGQLFIEWSDRNGAYTLALEDPAARKALLPLLSSGRPSDQGVTRTTRRLSASLIVLLVGLPIALLGIFLLLANPLVDWAVSKIPLGMEIKLGRQAFAQQRQGLTLLETHRALPMLRDLGARLTKGSAYPYEFYIARDASVNAYAMPGGFVVFHTGLLAKADSAEEVGGVLAHEVQHIERRHGLRALVHAAGWRVILSLLVGDTGASLAANWAANLGSLSFSRAQESEADMLGLRRLLDNRIDPAGMLSFIGKLSKAGPNVPALISSHPASEERFAAIQKAIPPGTAYQRLDYDYPGIKGTP